MQAVLILPAASRILSWFFDCAAWYAVMLAARRPWTNFAQSGLLSGTGRPFEHLRPGMISRFEASASAIELFSTAVHPPYVLLNGSGETEGSGAGLTSAGLLLCAKKITFELGNKIPLITCARFPYTCG